MDLSGKRSEAISRLYATFALMAKPPLHSTHSNRQRNSAQMVRPLLIQASDALRRCQTELARHLLMRALKIAPECIDAWRMLGMLDHRAGQYDEAISRFRRAVEIAPGDVMAHMGLGIVLHDHGKFDAALAAFERACELAPDSAACWFNLGKALRSRDDAVARACEALQHALACNPRHVPARLTLADVLVSVGDVEGAVPHYRKVLLEEPANDRAWWGLASFAVDSLTGEDVKRLQSLSERSGYADESGIRLGFALARALEKQGRYPAAFEALTKANAGKRRMLEWNTGAEHAQVKAIAEVFTQPDDESAPDPARGHEMIFVVSLPRSGSTLVEQILASHSEVAGGGEMLHLQQILDKESSQRNQAFPLWAHQAKETDWARLGTEYLHCADHVRGKKRYLTDKNILNWRYVGAVARMLPSARFVNIRRDRLETCLACYRQLFRSGMDFTYAFDDMVDCFRSYDMLCERWRTLYPQRFLDVEYEVLVANPENEIRRLLTFCGLSYESACLDFHRTRRVIRTASAAQVRQTLRKDTARADDYGDALAPLRQLLDRSRPDGER
ncbi:MAG TPA: sulfotransferase [Oleiagrimonas sp.]|nr:sulfotransferase [Oleiagrimonas sp.]